MHTQTIISTAPAYIPLWFEVDEEEEEKDVGYQSELDDHDLITKTEIGYEGQCPHCGEDLKVVVNTTVITTVTTTE